MVNARLLIALAVLATAKGAETRLGDIHTAIHDGNLRGVQAALLVGDWTCNGLAWCVNDTVANGVVVDINCVTATSISERAGCRVDWDNQSPLMHAVMEGHTEIVRLLLSLGADPSITDKDGYTPMMGAGFIGRTETAKVLMDHGLDLTAAELRTPIGADSEDMNGGLLEGHLGTRFGHPSVQRVLNYHIDDWSFIPGKGNYGERILLTESYRVLRPDGHTEHLHWHNFTDKVFVSNHKKAEFAVTIESQNGWLTEVQEWDYYETKSRRVPSPSPALGELPDTLTADVGVFACYRPVTLANGTNTTLHNHARFDEEMVPANVRVEYRDTWGQQNGWLTVAQESYFGLFGRHIDWDFDVPFLPESIGTLIVYPRA